MRGKTTRNVSTTRQKRTYKKQTGKKDEIKEAKVKELSVVATSKEKELCYEYLKKHSQKSKDKETKYIPPKIKIKCVPLNIEKTIIIKNEESLHEVKKIETKSVCGQVPSVVIKKVKNTRNKNSAPAVKRTVSVQPKKTKAASRGKKLIKNTKENKTVIKLKLPKLQTSGTELFTKGSNIETGDTECKEMNVKEVKFQSNTTQNFEQQLTTCNNSDVHAQELPLLSPVYDVENGVEFFGLNIADLDFEKPLTSTETEKLHVKQKDDVENEKRYTFTDVPTQVFNDKETKNLCMEVKDGKRNIFDNVSTQQNPPSDSTDSVFSRDKNLTEEDGRLVSNNSTEMSLQAAVLNFMNNPQLKCFKEIAALKKGLCYNWLSNNFKCSNPKCNFSHNALNLFTTKLRYYQSKLIMSLVVSMRNDILFVDVVMAAFKNFKIRQTPTTWVAFLVFFVFYVSKPLDSRLLKFWTNAARFFSSICKDQKEANGFACLLSIFSLIEKSEQWKIIEFIKLIKQPPVQVHINYSLLEPILEMDLPSQFLTDALEQCVATRRNVEKVYEMIIPKISVCTSPIQVVELLLKFCKILKEMGLKTYTYELKNKIYEKVKSFKSKINGLNYPLCAELQQDISIGCVDMEFLCTPQNVPEKQRDFSSKTKKTTYYFFHDENFFVSLVQEIKTSTEMTSFSSEDATKPPELVKTPFSDVQILNEKKICERQIMRIKQFFKESQFDLLGKYLNNLRPDICEQAAEEFLKLLYQMKISLQQGVDLLKIILLTCKSETAKKIIASVCITFIFNLIRINEWEKAHAILSLCREKQIDLIGGKVFYVKQSKVITRCRIALLLIEVYSYKGDYQSAMVLVKNLGNLIRTPADEIIKVRILEDLLQEIISDQLTDLAYDLFVWIWKEQKELHGSVELRKFINEILILLLNKDKEEEALTLYEQIKAQTRLQDITTRAILVTMVRRNLLGSAKTLLFSLTQNTYSLPIIISGSVLIKISCYWIEEEICLMFDALFDRIVSKKQRTVLGEPESLGKTEIYIRIWKPDNIPTCNIRPLCLGIINPSFTNACDRIQRVLNRFEPPLKIITIPFMKIDEHSLQLHLHNRICRKPN